MVEKTQLSVSITLDTLQKEGRFNATLTFACKSAEESFASFVFTYSRVPAEIMDLMEAMLEKALKRKLPVTLDGLTTGQMVLLERALIKLQLKLNDMAWRSRKMSSLQKITAARRALKPSQMKRLEWYTK